MYIYTHKCTHIHIYVYIYRSGVNGGWPAACAAPTLASAKPRRKAQSAPQSERAKKPNGAPATRTAIRWIYIFIYTYTHICIYIYMSMSMSVSLYIYCKHARVRQASQKGPVGSTEGAHEETQGRACIIGRAWSC